MLTIEDLKAMKPDTIFASGIKDGFRWVAVRGGIWDWAIYYQIPSWSNEEIARNGNKIHDNQTIKMLVPCDQEAFKMYRD